MIEVRDATAPSDELASLEMYNTVWPQYAIGIDESRAFRASLLDGFDYLACEDGVPVGSAAGGIRRQRPDRIFTLITVLAAARRRGAGSALYERVSAWARSRCVEQLESWVVEDDPESLAWAQRRKFTEIERDSRLVLDLSDVEAPEIDPPDGVEIVTWAERPDVIHGIYEVAREAYPDMPGAVAEEVEPFEEWLEHDMRGPGDRPDATFVALAGDEIVGYAKFSLTSARPTVAGHDVTGVKRSWRGRGVAGALKRAQIRWAKQQGYERLQTANEVRNEPMRRLNYRLGYQAAPGRISLLGPVSGAA